MNILQPQLFSATERVTIATVTRTTPFQEEKAVLSDRGSAQLCIYYPGTPDTTGINHIQFVPSVFCCCQPRSRSLVLCQQCIQFLLQRNEKTAKSQSKALWDTWVTLSATYNMAILGYITGAIINKSRLCWCLLDYKNFTFSESCHTPKLDF